MFKKTINNAKKIFTVSSFSKKEICSYYKISKNKIVVVYSSYNIEKFRETNILEQFDLKKESYYLSVGSYLPHKNFKIMIDYAAKHDNFKLVLNLDRTVKNLPKNIIVVKELNNNDLGTLYKNAYAYIQLSEYEGFGVPPLEAIKCGCKRIILSNIEAFKEIYKDIPSFVDIDKPFDLPKKIKIINNDKLDYVVKKYRWENTANIIAKNIN